MSTNNLFGSTIESDTFGIDLTGTFRTASFGGEKLENTVAPTVKTGLKLGVPGQ